uniref:Na/Pi symporter n=1 Tax=Marivirga aurantiaca TaxID=2802615 RepID=UPI0021D0F3CD|nr:Na/Pi symporter [Marivirga aurantiaca]
MLIFLSIFLFLFSIDFIGHSFKLLNRDIVDSILTLTSNPFIGLFIGLLITAVIQSSSTSTAMIVAVVASGSIGLSEAIPMIMGANIGTTLTSTLVSLSFITKGNEFRKAISAGVVHDFFNIFVVIILFPLEYYYGLLSNLATGFSSRLVGTTFINLQTELSYSVFTKPIITFISDLFPYPLVLAIVAFSFLAISIKVLSKFLYRSITGGSKEILKRYFFGGPYKSFFWGLFLTAGVQSSSVTTSVIVPFVATSKVSLKQAFTFILGANIGTTITALIAAIFKSEAAISIALVHLFFNLIGVLIFLPFPWLRQLPVIVAKEFGRMAMNYRITGFVYIILTFFIIPFLLISFNNESQTNRELTYRISTDGVENSYFKKVTIKSTEGNPLSHWFVYDELSTKEQVKNTPSKVFEVSRKNKRIIFDTLTFRVGKINDCLSGYVGSVEYEICLKNISKNFSFNETKLDSLYLYEMVKQDGSGSSTQFLIDVEKNILVMKEVFVNDSLIYEERIIQVNPAL